VCGEVLASDHRSNLVFKIFNDKHFPAMLSQFPFFTEVSLSFTEVSQARHDQKQAAVLNVILIELQMPKEFFFDVGSALC
jgi:hypothetical protein